MLRKGFAGRGVYSHKAAENLQQITPQACEEGEISLIALHSVRSIDSNWKNNKKHTTPGAASSENDRVLFWGGRKQRGRGKKLKFLSANMPSEIYLCHCHSSLKDNYSVPSFCHLAVITGKRAWVTYRVSIIK